MVFPQKTVSSRAPLPATPFFMAALAALTLATVTLATVALPGAALAHDPREREVIHSRHDFQATLRVLQASLKKNRMGLVTRASAQAGAKSLGVSIPGNQVWGLFAPKFAVRMLKASVEAGIEAPVRLYITEAPGGAVTVSYLKPTAVFAPYGNAALNTMAKELDAIFARIVADIRRP